MARESQASQANPVATSQEPVQYLKPREALTEEQQAYWDITVKSRPVDYFKEADTPILTQYVRHKSQADRLAVLIAAENALPPYALDVPRLQKLLKMQGEETAKIMACARSMRITHQSIYDEKTANTAANNVGTASAKPWEV